MKRRTIRRLRGPLAAGLILLLAAGTRLAPRALREMDSFRVRRVEVSGARFTDPYAVVRAAGLTGTDASVFDDPGSWETGVLTLPLVASVDVRRKLPGTVEVTITEVEPVALVTGERLQAVDAAGWLVPLDPAGALLDLPILTGVGTRAGRIVPEDGGSAALNALVTLQRDAPALAARVSQVERRPGMLRVVFRDGTAEALLPLDPSGLQLRQLRLAYADLAARGELPKVRRIDLRFRDQVVVSFLSRPVS